MSYESLKLTTDGPVAHLEMARPDKANAMGEAFWRELPLAIEAIDADTAIRAVVLSGQGRHFTAGIDLTMMQSLAPDPKADPGRVRERLRRKIKTMQETFTCLERCRKPVIAAIHNGCLGAGVDLVTACDLRFAAKDAKFTIQEINIGMVADVGTLQRIVHLLPFGLVKELAYTGRAMGADEAFKYGFVNGLAESREGVIDQAMSAARLIATKSPLAITGLKDVLQHAREHSISDGLDYVAAWNAGMLFSADLMKGAAAALQKREATFDDLLDH